MAKTLTLAEVAGMEDIFLTPETAAAVIGCDPHKIRVQASSTDGRAALGFPVVRLGTVTKIPRASFLRVMGWEGTIRGVTE